MLATLRTAFQLPGVTRGTIERFGEIAQRVQTGQQTAAAAEQEVAELGQTFSEIWAWVNANGSGLSVLIGLISLMCSIWALTRDVDSQSVEEASQLRHEDVEIQRDDFQSLEQQIQRLLDEPPAHDTLPPPTTQSLQIAQWRMPEAEILNRHARRKLAAQQRKS